MRVLPVTLVTGFLGAGKTTLIRRMLAERQGLKVGLVLNEFGQAGIDAVQTVDRAFIELTQGCACCVRNPDLVRAMEELAARGDLDRVLVEPSGLADPLPLSWTLQKPELSGKVRLDAVVAVVDPLHREKAGREEWEAQVSAADVVVVSKRDLAGAEAIGRTEAAVREVNPHARLLLSDDAGAVAVLLDVVPDAGGEPHGSRIRSLDRREGHRHSDFRAVSVEGPATYDLDRLEDLLESLPGEVFRAKGVVRTKGGWASFHVVGERAQVEPSVAAPEHGESRLLFFGRRLREASVLSLVARCRVAED